MPGTCGRQGSRAKKWRCWGFLTSFTLCSQYTAGYKSQYCAARQTLARQLVCSFGLRCSTLLPRCCAGPAEQDSGTLGAVLDVLRIARSEGLLELHAVFKERDTLVLVYEPVQVREEKENRSA